MGTLANVRKHFDEKTPLNKCYILTRSQIGELASKLSGKNFMQDVASGFADKSRYIISVKSYPIDLSAHYPTRPNNIVIGEKDTGISADLIIGGQDLSAYIDDAVLDMGTFRVEEYYHSFLDYSPYTNVQLWLPYGNFITLDTNLIMNKLIAIKYVISIVSGEATVYLLDVNNNNNVILATTVKIDFEIPFNVVNYSNVHKGLVGDAINFVGGTVSLLAGVASSNPVATAGGALKLASTTASAIVDTGNVKVEKGGAVDSTGKLFAPQKPYLIITRPNAKLPQYQSFKGYPSGKIALLGNVNGYTEIEDIHLENFGDATQAEIDEIEVLLKGGVIL